MSTETDVLTNEAVPRTQATLTIRIVKSFEFRTEKHLILHNIDCETTTVGQLKDIARQAIKTQPGWKPYYNVQLDTLKLYTKAHGAKTTNLIINLDNDDWVLDDDSKLLMDHGIENETEISFFDRNLYEAFKQNPEIKW